jgi:hypothetical protein
MAKTAYTLEAVANAIYPGLIAAIRASGPGQFMTDEVGVRATPDGGRLARARFALRYVYSPDNMLLRIETGAVQPRGATAWTFESYFYHCGPERYDEGATHFRVDYHPIGNQSVRHAHIADVQPHHIYQHLLVTNLEAISAVDFVGMVTKFRRDGKCPLVLKAAR